MDLQQLEYFVAVAEERHFTRAANRCDVAQSALSTGIRSLERELGEPLFIRTTRRVELTEAGRMFLPEAQRVLSAVATARGVVDECLGLVRGSLAIGRVWGDLSKALDAYHRQYPEVAVTLKQGLSISLIDDVVSGRLDCALVGLHPNGVPDGIRIIGSRSVPIGIACAIDHPLANRARIRVRQLAGEVFVANPADTASCDAIARLLAEYGVDYKVVYRVEDIPSMLEIVASRLAVALLPRGAARSRTDVAYVPLVGMSPSCMAGLITSKRSGNPAAKAFLDIVSPDGKLLIDL